MSPRVMYFHVVVCLFPPPSLVYYLTLLSPIKSDAQLDKNESVKLEKSFKSFDVFDLDDVGVHHTVPYHSVA